MALETLPLNLAHIETLTEVLASTGLHFGLNLTLGLLILSVGWWLSRRLYYMVRRACVRSGYVDATLQPVLCSLVLWSARLLTIIAVLAQFGVQTASIIAVLGAAGLAIGLALQGTLQNIAAGIMLLLLRPFQAGDYIEGSNQIEGTVLEIGLFSSQISKSNGVRQYVPNSMLWSSPVTNYNRNPQRRMDLTVSVTQDSDLQAGMAALLAMAQADPRTLPDPAPQAMVQDFKEDAIVLTLRLWSSAGDYWQQRWDFQAKLRDVLAQHGCPLAVPVRSFQRDNGAAQPVAALLGNQLG